MRFGLTQAQISEISAIIAKFPEIKEALIFGSRAMGNYREASDVDIAIKGDTTFLLAARVKDDLEQETYIPFFFDVLPYEKSNHAKLKAHVDKYGISFYRAGWKECTLGDVAKVQTGPFGSQLHASDYVKFGIPVIMPKNIGQRLDINLDSIAYITEKDATRLQKYRVKPNDIVFSRRGDVEKCAFITDEMNGWLCGTGGLKVSFQSANILPRFMAYYFSTSDSKHWLTSHAVGTTMPNLNSKILAKFPISLPPLEEQKAIAAVLSSLDDKIDLLHRQNKTLEATAQTLFRHWFVDEAQNWVELTELVEINPKLRLKKRAVAPYLEMKNVQSHSCIPSYWYDRPYSSGTRFQNGDTLMARITPCLENNKVAFVTFLNGDEVGWGSTEFLILRAKGELPAFYTYLLAKDPDFRAFAINSMTGSSGRQRIQRASLYNYQLGYPSPENLAIFKEQINPIEKKLNHNAKQVRTLQQLRDTLLPKLMSGAVRVK